MERRPILRRCLRPFGRKQRCLCRAHSRLEISWPAEVPVAERMRTRQQRPAVGRSVASGGPRHRRPRLRCYS